jgi:hypothetical protein
VATAGVRTPVDLYDHALEPGPVEFAAGRCTAQLHFPEAGTLSHAVQLLLLTPGLAPEDRRFLVDPARSTIFITPAALVLFRATGSYWVEGR